MSAGAVPLTDRKGGASSEDALAPAVAGRANDGLVVWCESNTKRMRAVLVSADGVATGDSFVIGPTPRPTVPTVATDGRDFLVAWVIDGRLTVAYVADGARVENISSTNDSAFDVKLAWSGTDYLLLLRSATEARVALLDRRGNVVRTQVIATSAQAVASIALASTTPNVTAFWVDAADNQVHALDVSPARIRSGELLPAAPAQVQPNGGNIIGPVVAVAGANGYLVVWTDAAASVDAGMKLSFRALTPGGLPLGSRKQVTIDVADREPVVYWNGTNYTVIYSVQRESVWAVMGMAITSNGEVLDGGPRQLAVLPQRHRAEAAAKIGTNAVLALQTFRTAAPSSVAEVLTLVVTPALSIDEHTRGTIVSRAMPAEDQPSAVWTGDDWVATWRERRNAGRVMVGRIAFDGTRIDPQGIAIDPLRPDENAQIDPAIATSGTEALVVWTDTANLSDGIIRGALIENTRSGALEPVAISISFDATASSAPAVVWDGQEYLVAWTNKNGQIVGVRVNRVGRMIDPFPVALTETPPAAESFVHPLLASRNDEILLVWQRRVVSPTSLSNVILAPPELVNELWAQHYDRSLFPVAGRIQINGHGADRGDDTTGASVVAGPDGYLIAFNLKQQSVGTTLVAFLLSDFGRTVPLIGGIGNDPTSLTWDGQHYLLAQGKQVLTLSPSDAKILNRILALPEGRTAHSIAAGGLAPLLLTTAIDSDALSFAEGFLLTAPRRRPR